MKRLSIRARLTVAFALAVFAALLCFGGAVSAVLYLDALSERAAHPGAVNDDFDDLRKAVKAMVAVSPLVVAAAALFGNLLSRRALAPLREASRRARRAQQTGEGLELPGSAPGDEWDELAGTLNALLADGRASLERIQRFTADAAHELRNPLTTLLGEADIALSAPDLPAASAEGWVAVKEEAERLRALLERLLWLARADADLLARNVREVDLLALARESIARGEGATPSVHVEVVGQKVLVRADPVLLSRAIENLLENALRYAARRVRVEVSCVQGWGFVCVEDDGPGVPPEHRSRLFERFFRADPSTTSPGTGLGLSIARAIARAHGGTLEYVDRAGGALFRLGLPEGG